LDSTRPTGSICYEVLMIYGEGGTLAAVSLYPVRAVRLAARLIRAALPRFPG
jgi:hypothetical protein